MREYRIGRLKGRFVVTWIEPDGRRRRYRLDALTRKAAETEALDVIAKKNLPKSGATVADLWGQYVDYLGDRPCLGCGLHRDGKQRVRQASFGAHTT